MRALIHIGFAKTGSSALQAYLSRQVARPSQLPYQYCAILRTGEVITGDRLAQVAGVSLLPYVSSWPMLATPDFDAAKARAGLAAIAASGRVPVLSQEAWGHLGSNLAAAQILDRLGLDDVEILAYVRPQAEYLQSGWWQWWRWAPEFSTPEDVVSAWGFGFLSWAALLAHWSAMPEVKRLTVRLQGADVVADFATLHGLPAPAVDARVNSGMSSALAGFYQALPALRGPHASGHDTLLAPYFPGGQPLPFTLPRPFLQRLVETLAPDNHLLRALLPADQRQAMADDPRWWSALAFPDAAAEPALPSFAGADATRLLETLLPEFLWMKQQHIAAGWPAFADRNNEG